MGEVKIDDLMNQVKLALKGRLKIKDISFVGDALRNSWTCNIVCEVNQKNHKTIIDIIDLHKASVAGVLPNFIDFAMEDALKLSK